MVIRVLWTPLAAKEDTVSSVAYYIPIDQRQADELRHSAAPSADDAGASAGGDWDRAAGGGATSGVGARRGRLRNSRCTIGGGC